MVTVNMAGMRESGSKVCAQCPTSSFSHAGWTAGWMASWMSYVLHRSKCYLYPLKKLWNMKWKYKVQSSHTNTRTHTYTHTHTHTLTHTHLTHKQKCKHTHQYSHTNIHMINTHKNEPYMLPMWAGMGGLTGGWRLPWLCWGFAHIWLDTTGHAYIHMVVTGRRRRWRSCSHLSWSS